MDAIALLKNDHRKVEQLFQRFNDGGGLTGVVKRLTGTSASARQRRSTAERICGELEVHARIEEQVFYPAVRALRDQRLSELVDESTDEHSTIKERVRAARTALDDDAELRTRIGSLQECVDHHVREEENEMFPLLEQRMAEDERAQVGRELAASKRAPSARGRKTARRATVRPAKPARTRKTTGTAQPARARKTTAKVRKRARTTKKASGDRRR
jgi:iron-sulfur cluster repair protein YtfE (RIC family)